MHPTLETAVAAVACLLLTAVPRPAHPQHGHPPARPDSGRTMPDTMPQGAIGMQVQEAPLGIPMTRTGSGTAWLPDESPMHAHHMMAGSWELMLHYFAYAQYDRQYGDRGDDQFGSINWAMLMAGRPALGGRLQLRGMMSAEPWTIGSRGYPLLLQTGESYRGQPLYDRQHPHDLFMELSAIYERALARDVGVQLYLAPVGEPAVGPVAYPHRPSAANDPLAPISHHWQDATHISFGVVTAGLFTRSAKLEGSIFNGREPDEIRTNFDFRRLDSYAGRLTVNPGPRWSLSAAYAYLPSPEGLRPDVSLHRVTASALYGRMLGDEGSWSSALIYGANKESDEAELSNSVVLETNLDVGRNGFSGRAEHVRKSARDLVLGPTPPAEEFDLSEVTLGYARELARLGTTSIAVGARGTVNFVPMTLEPTYGSRTPLGFAAFVRLRPKPMAMSAMGHGM